MPLFSKKNKNIGSQLESSSKEVFNKTVLNQAPGPAPVNPNVPRPEWTEAEIARYFVKVGLDNKGDLQSYVYEKGSSGTVEVKIDLVALAAACAGAPMPETPLFAEVGVKVSIEKTKNNLLMAVMAPAALGTLSVPRRVVFLGMTGFRFTSKLSASIEVGVKTPDIPGIPKPTGGDWNDKSPEVNKGTYAELVAFECGAKASYKAEVGITGSHIYVSDPAPTYLVRHLNGSSDSTMNELQQVLTDTLSSGDKKQVIKSQITALLEGDPDLRAFKPEPSWWKRNISGGNVTAASLLEALDKARTEAAAKGKMDALLKIDELSLSLSNYKDQEVLKPYSFFNLWSVSPEGSAGFSATASASFKAGIGVAGVGAEATATLAGPALSVSGKYSYFRVQVAALGELVTRPRSNAVTSKTPPRVYTPGYYVITTQDTRIIYGQVNLRLLGAGVKLGAGAQQGLFKDEEQAEKTREARTSGKAGNARAYVTGKAGLEETGFETGAEANLQFDLLNYLYYESATAIWSPPSDPGTTDGEERQVRLGQGSGYSFGESVTIQQVVSAIKKTKAKGALDGYLQGLANCIGVTHDQMGEFIESIGWVLEAFDQQADPNVKPEAFLVEASFVPPTMPSVAVRWKKGRWMLGPYGLTGTLRSAVIPKKHYANYLQAIRLRYRIADSENKRRTRFSLGFKYIGSLGVQLESVENAGSEGIVNLGTHWFENFSKYNAMTSQTQAYEEAVPQVALLHQ